MHARMAHWWQALHLIIEKLANVSEAIEFVQTQNDDELCAHARTHARTWPVRTDGWADGYTRG